MKETRDDICKNVLKKDKLGNDIGQESINDDLEGFISELQKHSLRPDSKWLYFLPKLAANVGQLLQVPIQVFAGMAFFFTGIAFFLQVLDT